VQDVRSANRDESKPWVVAIATSDWHISDQKPGWRGEEPDWWEAQKRPLDQLRELQLKYHCPILFAGDLFNTAKASNETVNWLIKHMPVVYGIPGNHDLPDHNYAEIHKSAYWTMVEAGKVVDIKPGVPYPVSDDLLVHGFPWGFEVKPYSSSYLIRGYHVALVHDYIWTKNTGFHGAPPDKSLAEWRKRLKSYRVACMGDQHACILSKGDDLTVVNPGTLLRRRSNEMDYQSRFGLLWSDGDVTGVEIDYTKDVTAGKKEMVERAAEKMIDSIDFMDALEKIDVCKIDFLAAVKEFNELCQATQEVRAKVREATEAKRK